jgi:hypothetical protein
MKKIATAVFAGLLAIGLFGAILFTACNKDLCEGMQCINGGFCVGGKCSCAPGYDGDFCGTVSRAKFIKSWNARDTAGPASLSYTVAIGAGSTITEAVISRAFSDSIFANDIHATVSGSTITVPDQQPDGAGANFRVAGTGTYAAGNISWTYTITRIKPAEVKTYTGTWQ